MKAATSNDIKKELKELPPARLIELCLRLARFKKENKELLTYLLFEAEDEEVYVQHVKTEIDEGFESITTSSIYLAKKSIRKVLRITNKFIRYSDSAETEVQLLLHFCATMKRSEIPFQKSNALVNLYNAQIKKIRASIESLHEDLQHDYLRRLDKL